MGPHPFVNGLVTERCPHDITIDFHTALIVQVGRNAPHLSSRCANCYYSCKVSMSIRDRGLEKEPNQKRCSHKKCFDKVWRTAKFCKKHYDGYSKRTPSVKLPEMRRVITEALPKAWEGNPDMDKMAELMAACQADPKRRDNIKFLDLEFRLRGGKIYEIAICDASGERILECHPLMTPGEEESLRSLFFGTTDALPEHVAKGSAKKKLGHVCADGFLDVHEVAKRLREHGVSPRTIFVAWGTSKIDLTLLRRWLEAGGYYDILPEGENCVLLPLFTFRNNFKRLGLKVAGKKVPCGLELVFPAIFGPHHHLAFKNHLALIDTYQLWLLTKALLELLKHPSERTPTWLKDLSEKRMISGKLQTILDEFFRPEPGTEIDNEEGGEQMLMWIWRVFDMVKETKVG